MQPCVGVTGRVSNHEISLGMELAERLSVKKRCFYISSAAGTGNGGAVRRSGKGSGMWSRGEPRSGIAETETERGRKPRGRFENGRIRSSERAWQSRRKDNGDSRNTVVACRSTARGYAGIYIQDRYRPATMACCPSSQSIPFHPIARVLACHPSRSLTTHPASHANLAYPCPPFPRIGYPKATWHPPVLPDPVCYVLRTTVRACQWPLWAGWRVCWWVWRWTWQRAWRWARRWAQ